MTTGVGAGVGAKLPLTTFRGWLKRLDPGTLNPGGQALMGEVFPRFAGEHVRPEESAENTERLISLVFRAIPSRAVAVPPPFATRTGWANATNHSSIPSRPY